MDGCNCLNGGVCADVARKMCECRTGFVGKRCEVVFIDFVGKEKEDESENDNLVIILVVTMLVLCVVGFIGFLTWRRYRAAQAKKRAHQLCCEAQDQTKKAMQLAKGVSQQRESLLPNDNRKEEEHYRGYLVINLEDNSTTLVPGGGKLLHVSSEGEEPEQIFLEVERSVEHPGRKRKRGISF